MDIDTASIEIEITPPGPPGTSPWWTVLFDGATITVRAVPELDGDQPDDWGIVCTRPEHIQAWRTEGGSGHVIDRILDGFTTAGARVRIVGVQGPAESVVKLQTALRVFAQSRTGASTNLRGSHPPAPRWLRFHPQRGSHSKNLKRPQCAVLSNEKCA